MAHLCVGTARLVEGRASTKAWQLQRRGRGRLQETRSIHSQAYPTSLSPGPASACWSRADIGHSAVNCTSRQASGAPGLRASRG